MRILLVEDDAVSRRIMERIARGRGHEATAFATAREGLAAHRAEPFDLIVTDWQMPEMDGLSLCRAVRELPGGGEPVVLVVTARDQARDLEAVLEAGADDYLAKSSGFDLFEIRLTVAEKSVAVRRERRRADDALREAEAFLRSTLDALALRVGILDGEGRLLAVNAAWRDAPAPVFPGCRCAIGGDYVADCAAGAAGEAGVRLAAAIRAALAGERAPDAMEYAVASGRNEVWYYTRLSRFAGTEATRIVVAHENVTERKENEKKLERFALHDPLTGLFNRAHLEDRLRRACADARHNPAAGFGLLYLDLDDFKSVNDTLGHAVGDELLVAAAGRMERSLRPGDSAYRLGGDEFVVFLAGARSREDVDAVRVRLTETLGRPYRLHDHDVVSGASVGWAIRTEALSDPAAILEAADAEMYRVKREKKIARGG